MEDISLHILDIAENSINAGAGRIEITITENIAEGVFELSVGDDGKGMSADRVLKAGDAFFTSKAGKRFGLGLPLLAQAAEECGGRLRIKSEEGKGTVVTARFGAGHIDMKPLGDLGATMTALIAGHPEKDYLLSFERDGRQYRMDTAEIRKVIDGVSLGTPELLVLIREDINEAVGAIKRSAAETEEYPGKGPGLTPQGGTAGGTGPAG